MEEGKDRLEVLVGREAGVVKEKWWEGEWWRRVGKVGQTTEKVEFTLQIARSLIDFVPNAGLLFCNLVTQSFM